VSSWDRLSPCYDWQLGLERPALQAAVELAAPRPEDRLLDLGTGTAALLRELARLPSRPREAVGVDTSPKMLGRARGLPPGWRLELGDAQSLPFADSSFDIVTATYLLHLLDPHGVRNVLLEARRLLAGGGRFVAVTPDASPTVHGRTYVVGVTNAARLAPWLFSGLRSYDPQPALVGSGFRVLATRLVTKGYRSLCVRAEPARLKWPA
jgi:ubiquinone/menaquinone biosynthesis C-methylase UbiE